MSDTPKPLTETPLSMWERHTCDGKPTERCAACWALAYEPLEAYRTQIESLQKSNEELTRQRDEARREKREAVTERISVGNALIQQRDAERSIVMEIEELLEWYDEDAPVSDRVRYLVTERQSLSSSNQRLTDALTGLVAKIDECNPHIASAFQFMAIHSVPYNGPNYAAELESARELIAREAMKGGK